MEDSSHGRSYKGQVIWGNTQKEYYYLSVSRLRR